MKYLLLILTIVFSHFSCSTKKRAVDFEYIKVFTSGSTDSITKYNKGLGIYNYLYYEPISDSIIYRDLTGIEPYQYKTFIGNLDKDLYIDTLLKFVEALRKYNNGIIPDKVPEGNTYCGQQFYVEFKDKNGIHFNAFLSETNRALDDFDYFFHRLTSLPWEKQQVDNSLVNVDREAVAALDRLGLYKEMETPYIPLLCEPGIDMTKIFGTWRMIRKRYRDNNNFTKFTFKKNGVWLTERIREDSTVYSKSGKFTINTRANTFILKLYKSEETYTILKLSDKCFEFKKPYDEYSIRFDRL